MAYNQANMLAWKYFLEERHIYNICNVAYTQCRKLAHNRFIEELHIPSGTYPVAQIGKKEVRYGHAHNRVGGATKECYLH